MLHERTGVVEHRRRYSVVRSPANPSFHWGNLLLFPTPPAEGDFERWIGWFRDEFRREAAVRHMTFAWDVSDSDPHVRPFQDAGFEVDRTTVLTATHVHLDRPPNAEIHVRAIRGGAEWAKVLEHHYLVHGEGFEEERYYAFARSEQRALRALVEEGRGRWFGAFLGGRLVADLGIFVFDGVGRFRTVGTHPDFRRRGICSTLVYEASRFAFSKMGANTLVLEADEGDVAADVYARLGYERSENLVGLCRPQPACG